MTRPPRLLLASDFDGTLAGIRDEPDAVVIDPEALEVLGSAASDPLVALAIVSGRDLSDLRPRLGGLRAWMSGSHGQELVDPDGRSVRTAEPWKGHPDAKWVERATAAGLRLEPKRFGVAIHWRGVSSITASHPLVAEFERWAAGEGLEVIHGRCVAEASRSGASKRAILETLLELTGAPRLLYAGDDLTDFPALELAATRGRGFFIPSAERSEPPPAGVEVVAGREELIRRFREELSS